MADTQEELNKKEKYWINYYNTQCQSIGYNITDGGAEGFRGFHHSIETRKAISQKLIGREHTPEARLNMSSAQKKVKHLPASEETKQKMSKSHTGHLTSSDTREKISKSNSGKVRTPEQNKQNSKRQTGKQYMFNAELKIYAQIFPLEFDYYLSNGWEFGKGDDCNFIYKKDLKKVIKTT